MAADPGHEEEGNPGKAVTKDLCAAYRETIHAEIRGLRNTIIVGLTISTLVVSVVITVVQLILKAGA